MGKAKKQKVVAQTPPAKGKKAKPAKPVPTKDESEEDSSSEEEVQTKVQTKAAPAKVVKKTEESSEESSSEEEEVKAAPQKNAKKAAKRPAAKEEESSDDSDEEEEAKPVKNGTKKGAKAAKAAVPAKKAKKEESSSEEDSDDDEEEEAPAKKPAAAAKTAPQKKAAAAEEDDDDDDDSEDDSDEEEEEAKPAKKAAVNGAKAAKKTEDDDDSDDDDDDDDSSDDDDDDEEEEEVKAKDSNKRKKEKAQAPVPAKKAKVEENGDSSETVTLFVGNLDKETTESDLQQFFVDNGVSVAEVRKPPNKMNAFVDLINASDVDAAIALSGNEVDGRAINVEKAKPRAPRDQNASFGNNSFNSQGGGKDGDDRTLFVKNLPEDATADALREIFDTAVDVRLPMKDGYHKGFGFIEFSDSSTMESAMSEKQGADLNGSSLYLDYMGQKSSFKSRGAGRGGDRRGRGGFDGGDRRHSNSGARGESKVIFVKNLSYDTEESTLMSLFKGAKSARIPTFADSGKPRGFAFVDFDSAEKAAAAYDSMNGESIDGRQVRLDFAAEKGEGGGFGGRDNFSPRGRGGRGGGRGFGGGRGRGGFDRGRGGRGGRGGGFNKAKGGIVASEGKKMTFDDSD